MSIAITGQQKYRYQDLVCALLALHFGDVDGMSLFVEPPKGEDALLTRQVGPASIAQQIHIQVKGSAEQFDLNHLADWLLHFPDHEHTNSLLERLVQGNGPVLIVAWARCSDDVATYVLPQGVISVEGHAEKAIRLSDAKKLRETLVQRQGAMPVETSLGKKRAESAEKFISVLDDRKLKQALSNLLIVERLNESTVRRQLEDMLREEYGVPIDHTEAVSQKMLEVVMHAKGRTDDVIAGILAILGDYRVSPMLPTGYVSRGDERSFKDKLARDRALLISGTPRMGKSTLIRQIASDYAKQGFQLRETADVEEASRFLLDPVRADRIAILDDPLGGAHDIPGANNIYARIEKLIIALHPTRRLLVAQRQDRLLQTTRKSSLVDVRTGRVAWQDLSQISKEFSIDLWRHLTSVHAIPAVFAEVVLQAIETDQIQLEPGCLSYLAATHEDLGESPDLNMVIRHARLESRELGCAFDEDGMRSITMAMAIATESTVPVARRELAFVDGSGSPSMPAKIELNRRSLKAKPKEDDENGISAYSYSEEPALSEEKLNGLRRLELRRIISVRAKQDYLFSHPFYRAAAESLYDSATEDDEDHAIEMVRRALLCVSPQTATAAAKNLSWVYGQLGDVGRQKIIACAKDGIHSAFPAVRDVCYAFLMTKLSEMPPRAQKEITQWVQAVSSPALSEMKWVDGQPQIKSFEGSGLLHELWSPRIDLDEDIEATLRELNSNEVARPSPQRAARVLIYYAQNPEKLTDNALLRLLSYDISLLRAKAVGIWLSFNHADDEAILDRIFDENHPKVAMEAVDSILSKWARFPVERKERLLNGLIMLCHAPGVSSAVVSNILYDFTEDEVSTTQQWEVFSELMSVILNSVPNDAFFSEDRLYLGVEAAIPHISLDAALRLLGSWIGLIERRAEVRLSSEYLLGVSTLLLQATKKQPSQRIGLIHRLLKIHGTGPKLRVMADLIDEWDQLVDSERSEIIALLRNEAPDSRWLRGVAITRKEIPAEIEQALCPNRYLFSQSSAEEILKYTSSELLIAAAQVYMGDPQPLWYLGTHHSGKKIWAPVIEEIACRPEHPLFRMAWSEVTFSGDGVKVAILVNKLGETHKQQIFERLLEEKIRVNGNFMPEAWAALFALTNDEEIKAKWLTKMADEAYRVLESLDEVEYWIPESYRVQFRKKLFDSAYMSVLELIFSSHPLAQEQKEDNVAEKIFSEYYDVSTDIKNLEALLKIKAPELIDTYDWITRILKRLKIDAPEFLVALEQERQLLIKKKFLHDATSYLEIDHWIH